MSKEISNTDDIIDSRDVIARIEELEEAKEEFILQHSDIGQDSVSWGELAEKQSDAESEWDETSEGQELKALKALADQAEGYCSDWTYGESLIRDDHFEDYARQLAEELDLIKSNVRWPYTCIDWTRAAEELQMDYTSVDFDGVTYWVR